MDITSWLLRFVGTCWPSGIVGEVNTLVTENKPDLADQNNKNITVRTSVTFG